MINILRKRAIDKLLRLSYARQLFFAPGSQCAYFIADVPCPIRCPTN